MARVTVEDCLAIVPNRFSLVLAAAERTKQLLRGAPSQLEEESDNKEIVDSLREIAAGCFEIDQSAVLAVEKFLPKHRQTVVAQQVDDELPPEADDELLPDFIDDIDMDLELPPEPAEPAEAVNE
jgi:DNA-directed RNA polymerase subunit omega